VEKTLHTDVLIVGGGPTGLMAANQLARFGVDFILIDKKSGPTIESRAIAVTARSLELYQQMGIHQEAINGGKLIQSFNLYSQGKRKAEVKIGEIGKGLSEFSYMLAFEQSKNEELLASNLKKLGKPIHWQYEFVELKDFKESITAVAKHGNDLIQINAKYLIACDGANSAVRQQLKFSFEGGTYSHKFFVADTQLQWDEPYNKLIVAPGDKNFCAFFPLYGEKSYRVIGSLPKHFFNKEDISFSDIENVVMNTLGIKAKFEKVNWFSTYKLHHRGVDHFKEGNVFLAGDSAHIHSPAGGQGMNTGLQDAYNLCWKLALVLKKQAQPSILDTYNEERLPFARWLLKFTDRGFNIMTSDNWIIKTLRKYVAFNLVGMFTTQSRIRPVLFKVLSQIWYSYSGKTLSGSATGQKLKFKAGDRVPYLGDDNIYPSLTDASFHLVHIHSEPLDTFLQKRISGWLPFPVKVIECPLNKSWLNLGVVSELFILVRPDNYIGFLFDKVDENEIRGYLRKYFVV
jgi:2-polyprenyl-6-methoxyphenol hydroxylase-like FAD-dependent oxidoreductase